MLCPTFVLTLFLASVADSLNILMNNDDGFGSSNIREFYRQLKAAGHNAWMVAPVTDQSGQGGRLSFTTSPTLAAPSEFGLIPAGAPSLGTDPHDNHIWYFNGTPSACTLVGLDYVLPNFAPFSTPDLLVSGPNFGDNLGPFAYTGSGTIGATYTAIERGIPGIAFSGMDATASYTNGTGYNATHIAAIAVQLVELIANNTAPGERLLPLGYGLNVNYPYLNESCVAPPFVKSRLTGGAGLPMASYNKSSGLFGVVGGNYYGVVGPGLNTCYNGDCSEPGETVVVTACEVAVSVFTVDYDAPDTDLTRSVKEKFSKW